MSTYRSHIHHHIHHHAKRVIEHVNRHHHKYLLAGGVASGTFVAFKIIMLFAASFSLYSAQNSTSFADEFTFSSLDSQPMVAEQTDIESSSPSIQQEEDLIGNQEIANLLLANQSQDPETTAETEIATENEQPPVLDIQNETPSNQTGNSQTGFNETGSNQPLVPVPEQLVPVPEQQAFTVCSYEGFSSPIVQNVYTGVMNISWNISPDCSSETVDLQLYDHNEQWISLAQFPGTTTQYAFDTKLLLSGFYNQTGIDANGNSILLPGLYSGVALNFWSGYRLRWLVQGDNILAETPQFAIDNSIPTLSNIALTSSGYASGFVGRGYTLQLQFDASEVLSGVNVTLGTDSQPTLTSVSGTHYTYTYVLPSSFSSGGYIGYTITYGDSAGFTGAVAGVSNLFYDIEYPEMTGFTLEGYNFSFTTSELTRATLFVLIRNTTSGWAFNSSNLTTNHSFSLPTLALNTNYDMGIIIKDRVGNESKAAFSLGRNASGVIQYDLLATLYGSKLTTYSTGSNFMFNSGTVELSGTKTLSFIKDRFTTELNNFAACKNSFKYKQIKLQVKGHEFTLNMPVFQRDDTKKIVNGFVLYIMKSLETSALDEAELQDIAQNFDNFTLILKLVRENNNNPCKQNLSNYHLEQFKQSLKLYGIKL